MGKRDVEIVRREVYNGVLIKILRRSGSVLGIADYGYKLPDGTSGIGMRSQVAALRAAKGAIDARERGD